MSAAPIEAGQTGQDPQFQDIEGDPAEWPVWPDDDVHAGLATDAEPADPGQAAQRSEASAQVSDHQLARWIDAVVDHDELALAALYDATFARVFGIVRRIVRGTALAEEVVEETYFQVWRQAVRFDATRGSALTWLLAIARSRAIDALRHEARFQHDALDDDQAPATAGDATPQDDLLDVARHHAHLQRALTALGAQPRQLVSLAFFRGLSHEEIATQTHLPLGTVKSQIRRALLTLRQILADGGLEPLAS